MRYIYSIASEAYTSKEYLTEKHYSSEEELRTLYPVCTCIRKATIQDIVRIEKESREYDDSLKACVRTAEDIKYYETQHTPKQEPTTYAMKYTGGVTVSTTNAEVITDVFDERLIDDLVVPSHMNQATWDVIVYSRWWQFEKPNTLVEQQIDHLYRLDDEFKKQLIKEDI